MGVPVVKKATPNQYRGPFWAARREHAWILRTKHKLTYAEIARRLGVTRVRPQQMIAKRERQLRWGVSEERL